MRFVIQIVFLVLIGGYPFAVYFGLNYWQPQSIAVVLFVVFIFRLLFLKFNPAEKYIRHTFWPIFIALLVFVIVIAGGDQQLLLFTPVIINGGLLAAFMLSLFYPPPVVEMLARFKYPDLPPSGVEYTRKVTIVWCFFFIVNGMASLYTVLYASLEIWTLYNGLLSYTLMGLLFLVEYIIRIRKLKEYS